MDKIMLTKFNGLFEQSKITMHQLYATFHIQENFKELVDEIGNFIKDNIEELSNVDDFYNRFHLFLFSLSQNINNKDDTYLLKNMLSSIIKELKEIIKPYNKKEIKKDHLYYKCYHFEEQLKTNLDYLNSSLFELSENNEFKIIWFIINNLQNPDYVFRIIEMNPHIVNAKSNDGSSLFYKLIEYYLQYIDTIDVKYYKRIFVMLLESDKLLISNDELIAILDMLSNDLSYSNINNRRHINFVIQEINRHYTIINSSSRCNTIDFAKNKMKVITSKPSTKKRKNLTNLFTLSIDSVKEFGVKNLLIDDAFSIERKTNGNYILCIHIPDVDYYIKRDTPEDDMMRNVGESIYAHNFKVPLISYEASKTMSLNQGKERPAITFAFTIDSEFNILRMAVMESIINVNYNLSVKKAELFMNGSHDKTLTEKLNMLYMLSRKLRKERKEKIGNLRKPQLIMDELNILLNIYVANYFNKRGIIFPYKNYFGLRSHTNAKHIEECNKFVNENELTDEEKALVYSVFNINNRVFYDTVAYPNSSFNGNIIGNVGNPLREYISLETLRLIKDILIKNKTNFDYWEDRIEKDVIDYTESGAKIRELYTRN